MTRTPIEETGELSHGSILENRLRLDLLFNSPYYDNDLEEPKRQNVGMNNVFGQTGMAKSRQNRPDA